MAYRMMSFFRKRERVLEKHYLYTANIRANRFDRNVVELFTLRNHISVLDSKSGISFEIASWSEGGYFFNGIG